MGFSIACESATAEYSVAEILEHSASVLEYWDQPEPRQVTLIDKNGQSRRYSYHPDFLVLDTSGPSVVQVKPGAELDNYLATGKSGWVRTDGGFSFVPADDAFRPVGIPHQVLDTRDLNATQVDNYRLLRRVPSLDPKDATTSLGEVAAVFKDRACLTVLEVATALGSTDVTRVYQLVKCGVLHARLEDDRLAVVSTAWVARKADHLIAAPPAGRLTLNTLMSAPPVFIPSRAATERALRRLQIVKDAPNSRTGRRIRKLLTGTQSSGQSDFERVRPAFERCGNRRPRISSARLAALERYFDEAKDRKGKLQLSQRYEQYKEIATQAHPDEPPLSRTTFAERLARRPLEQRAFSEGGKRAANAAAAPTPVESRALVPLRPFEIGSIDHCLLPLLLLLHSGPRIRITRQPWVTVLRDVATGLIVALWMSLMPPSRATDAIVVRRCVRAFGRFFEAVISDSGADFTSHYWPGLLAHLKADCLHSPVAFPRGNQSVEAVFALMRSSWLPGLPGNAVDGVRGRAVSASHTPSALAELTPEDAWKHLLQFQEWANSREIGVDRLTATEAFRRGIERFGFSGTRHVVDQKFLISTSIAAQTCTYDSREGVRLGDRRYFTPALLEMRPARRSIEARPDPENPHVLYVRINGLWHVAAHRGVQHFVDLDEISQLAEVTRVVESARVSAMVRAQERTALSKRIAAEEASRKHRVLASEEAALSTGTSAARSWFDEVRALPVEPLTDPNPEV
jgi:putative transposase